MTTTTTPRSTSIDGVRITRRGLGSGLIFSEAITASEIAEYVARVQVQREYGRAFDVIVRDDGWSENADGLESAWHFLVQRVRPCRGGGWDLYNQWNATVTREEREAVRALFA